MTNFKTILLSEIHPDPNQPRKFFAAAALQELTESIKEKGVLQPILVRLNGNGYKLVCGERRYKAATAAGLKEIPAVIRELTDEETLEIQFIENIQRDDVHPMDEATIFKQMLENKVHPYTLEDIGAKINKPVTYVAHRLALNNLIEDLQKDFWSGKFLIGHAVLFARLSQEDQKELKKNAKEWSGKEYKSIAELKNFIERDIMRVLSKAPFKKEDADLNPAMGPCTTCASRSGNSPALFDDIKEKDRCFKPACYEKKIAAHALKAITEALEQEPDTVFLESNYARYKPDAAIVKLLDQYTIKPLKEYHNFDTYISKGDKKTKGIWINGDKTGSVQFVKIKSAAASSSKQTKQKEAAGVLKTSDIDEEIQRLRDREKRAKELDAEKIREHVNHILRNSNLFTADQRDHHLTDNEITAAAVALFDAGSYDFRDWFKKRFKTDGYDIKPKNLENLKLTEFGLNEIIFQFILDKLISSTGSYLTSGKVLCVHNIAKDYHAPEVNGVVLDQQDKADKRSARVDKRIAELQEQKKLIKPKPAPKKAAKKK
jgi:ParB/RepB/Spo0J family partition protein